MSPEDGGSVTRWLGDLKAGDPAAAQKLWERYFTSLVRLAQAKLRSSRRVAEDEEDAALSAFGSFCASAAEGRFPRPAAPAPPLATPVPPPPAARPPTSTGGSRRRSVAAAASPT